MRWHHSLPSTVKVTLHCASPVSQVYVPESSGTILWIRSCWDAPFFFRSYLGPSLMAMLFLLQMTVPLGSEMVQARVTVSPSNARVLCGFSNISTANIRNQNRFRKSTHYAVFIFTSLQHLHKYFIYTKTHMCILSQILQQ